jgi:hypothetical protein
MRHCLVSALIGAGLVIAILAGRGESQGPLGQATGAAITRSYAPAQGGELISHFGGADGQPLALTVIDPREQWIGVYHVDRASGEITLKSARKYTWDLQLIDFNSGKPLPQDIRSGLPR